MATYGRLHSNDNTNAGLGLLIILLWLVAAGGWIANVVKIFGSLSDPITAFFIARVAGVFLPPVGAVLGFL